METREIKNASEVKELPESELKDLKKKALDILSVARRNILSEYPFIGNIALRMEMVPIRDVRVPTACTDGNTVYFDIAFLSSLSRDEQTFVLAHEIWHAVLLHLVRRHGRDPELFNIATDKEVNYLLSQDGFKAPADLCWPTDAEKGKCAEEIYEMMLKDAKKKPSPNGKKGKAGGKPGDKDKEGGSSGQSEGQGSGNKKGKLSGQFDKHVFEGDEQQSGGQPGEGEGQGGDGKCIADKYGKVGLDRDFQPKVSKDFADRMRETIISEAQRAEKMRGNLPAHIKELIKDLCTPELKWQELLAQFVTRCYNSGSRSWIPPNRRHIHNDVYLQSRQAAKIKIAVGVDTSGSTMSDRSKFLTELQGLVRSFGSYQLTIIECDAEVGDVKTYTQDDDFEGEIENGEYSMSGGGGTRMKPIYDYILDHQIECDAIAIMTDGYIEDIPENPIPTIPTLWVITKGGTEDFCDWGQKIKFKNDSVN